MQLKKIFWYWDIVLFSPLIIVLAVCIILTLVAAALIDKISGKKVPRYEPKYVFEADVP